MKMNYKHLGLYVLAGIVSGGLSTAEWLLAALNDFDMVMRLAMPITLAAGIYTVGRYVSDTDLRHTWFSPVALVVTCLVGWYLASMFAGRCLDTFFWRRLCVWMVLGDCSKRWYRRNLRGYWCCACMEVK